jgi:pyrimidine-nucleoside phosphorylase
MTQGTSPTYWIEQKKQGLTHSEEDIVALVTAVMEGRMQDYQLSAWLMAVCLKGLNEEESYFLTKAFVDSGETLNLHAMGIEGTTVDKHSTGGVGDKTTLVVAPLMAAAGLKVAKLSGRGLGFTGGTIDKLEAIPHFKVNLSETDFVSQIKAIGLALSAQTPKFTPADGIFYALRDVTATVDNLSLIAASVMSKKIAAGADVIVLDIKVGRGAFMKSYADAEALSQRCIRIGERFGKAIQSTISSMEAPLGRAVGHTVEVLEAIDTLKGKGPKDLEALCLKLTAMALIAAGRHTSLEEALPYVQQVLDNGAAYEKFVQWVHAQGGDVNALVETHLLPQPKQKRLILAPQTGVIESIDALAIAKVVKALGGGRSIKTDPLDYSVGLILYHSVGESIQEGASLCELWIGDVYHESLPEMILDAIVIKQSP